MKRRKTFSKSKMSEGEQGPFICKKTFSMPRGVLEYPFLPSVSHYVKIGVQISLARSLKKKKACYYLLVVYEDYKCLQSTHHNCHYGSYLPANKKPAPLGKQGPLNDCGENPHAFFLLSSSLNKKMWAWFWRAKQKSEQLFSCLLFLLAKKRYVGTKYSTVGTIHVH